MQKILLKQLNANKTIWDQIGSTWVSGPLKSRVYHTGLVVAACKVEAALTTMNKGGDILKRQIN